MITLSLTPTVYILLCVCVCVCVCVRMRVCDLVNLGSTKCTSYIKYTHTHTEL